MTVWFDAMNQVWYWYRWCTLFQFCQPNGWFPTHDKEPPKYFIAVLTDELGKRRYLAVLTFCEPVSENNSSEELLNGKITRRESSKTVRIKGQHEDVDESMCEVYVDEESENSSGLLSPSSSRSNKSMSECYFPKCLVIISRHPEFSVFKVSTSLYVGLYIHKSGFSREPYNEHKMIPLAFCHFWA